MEDKYKTPEYLRRPPRPPEAVAVVGRYQIVKIHPNPSGKTDWGMKVKQEENHPLFPNRKVLVVEKTYQSKRAKSAGLEPRDILIRPSPRISWEPLSMEQYEHLAHQSNTNNQAVQLYVARKTNNNTTNKRSSNVLMDVTAPQHGTKKTKPTLQVPPVVPSMAAKKPSPDDSTKHTKTGDKDNSGVNHSAQLTSSQVAVPGKYSRSNYTQYVGSVKNFDIFKVHLQASQPGQRMGLRSAEFPIPPELTKTGKLMKIVHLVPGGLAEKAGVRLDDLVVLPTKTNRMTLISLQTFKATVRVVFETTLKCTFFVARKKAQSADRAAPVFSPLQRVTSNSQTPVPKSPSAANKEKAKQLLDFVQSLESTNRKLWKQYRKLVAEYAESVVHGDDPSADASGYALQMYMDYCKNLGKANDSLAAHIAGLKSNQSGKKNGSSNENASGDEN